MPRRVRIAGEGVITALLTAGLITVLVPGVPAILMLTAVDTVNAFALAVVLGIALESHRDDDRSRAIAPFKYPWHIDLIQVPHSSPTLLSAALWS